MAFAETHNLGEHAALFGRAAMVARDMNNFNDVADLSEDERRALEYERDHKWHGPKMLWYSIGLCAIGAATQGWDQTGSNGANLTFHEALGIDSGSSRDEWLIGLINSIIFLTAGLMLVTINSRVLSQLLTTRTQWRLYCRSSQPLLWPARRDLHHGFVPYCDPDRLRFCANMARSLRGAFRDGHRHRREERYRAHLLR